jgi:hypothetical protein
MEYLTAYVQHIENAFRAVDVVNRYSKILSGRQDVKNIISRMDRKENLNVLRRMGYEFKIFSPGQHYELIENFGRFKFVFSSQISKGIIAPYIFIYVDENKIPFKYTSIPLVCRYLKGNMNGIGGNIVVKDLSDFEEVMIELLSIYEDFKKEFLKRVLPSENEI